jgi:AraC-like DNA-binding protein
MRYQEVKPSATAGGLVRCYWMLEDTALEPDIQRIVPDGRAELIFNLGQPYESRTDGILKPQPQSFLYGQITGPPGGSTSGSGANDRHQVSPSHGRRILRIPMRELTDTAVPVEDISGRLFRELQELGESRSPLERFAALDRIMLALGKYAGPDDALLSAAVRELEAAGGSMSVAAVADHAGLSARQFERRFRQAVGISPKLFSRMQRFQRVFPALENTDAGKPPAALLAEDTDPARHFVQYARMSHFSKTRAETSR